MDLASLIVVTGSLLGGLILYAMQGAGLFLKGKQADLEAFLRSQGRPLGTWDLRLVRASKSNYYRLVVRISLPSAPGGLTLKNEGLATGFYRISGKQEQSLGDPEFDAAFWIEAPTQQDRDYLTPLRRRTLLCGMTRNPGWTLERGTLQCERLFSSSLFGRSTYAAIWADLELLLDGLEGTGERVPPKPPQVVAGKVRRLVPATVALLALTLPFSRGVPGLGPDAALWAAVIGLVFSGVALTGSEAGRVLLQGYYAFLSLAALVLAGTIGSGALGPFKRPEDQGILVVMMLGLSVCFWAARHYLRSMRR